MTEDIAANKGRAARLVGELALPVFAVVLVLVAAVAGIAAGVVVALVVGAALGAYLWLGGAGAARRALGGRPADPEREARLVNLVEGLGTANGALVPLCRANCADEFSVFTFGAQVVIDIVGYFKLPKNYGGSNVITG